MTAASATAACAMRTSSISPGEMFSAPRTMTSSSRPSTYKKPCTSNQPASRVRNQPSSVSVVCPTYSPATCSPRTQISPFSPGGSTASSLSRTSTSRAGRGRPTEPSRARMAGSSLAKASRCSSGVSMAIVELVSVSPYALTRSMWGRSVRVRSTSSSGMRPPP